MSPTEKTQICLHGHMYSYYERPRPQIAFCDLCGQKVLDKCEKCEALLPIPRYINHKLTVPSYCTTCGKGFPWTEAQLSAAEEALEEVENLTPEEKESIRRNLPDVIHETARTEIAVSKVQKIWSKAQGPAKSIYENIVTPLLVEAGKRALNGLVS